MQMLSSAALGGLLAFVVAAPATAQCPERWKTFDGTGLVSSGMALFPGEEGGVVVDGIPHAHFPIAITSIGIGWFGEPNAGGSVHVYGPGTPRAFDEPLHSVRAPVLRSGRNTVELEVPLVLTAQPFVLTYRHGPSTVPGDGVLALDGNGARGNASVARLVHRPGPAWIGAPGDWVMWIEYLPAHVGASFCHGDGTDAICPCGPTSSGAPGAGCTHGFGPGATLVAAGGPRVTSDSLRLSARGLPPNAPTLFFQYTESASPMPFGGGLLCSGGELTTRLFVAVANEQGEACSGAGAMRSLAQLGHIPPAGGTRCYQAWFRDPMPLCNAATNNLTSGVRLTWVP